MAPSSVVVAAAAVLLMLSILTPQISSLSPNSNTLHIFHSAAASFSSWDDFLSQDQSRLSYLTSLATARRSFVPLASATNILRTSTYVVRAKVGTPPQPVLLSVDTSSDAAWIPSSSCLGCPSSSFAPFKPTLSTTYKPLPCSSPLCARLPTSTCSSISRTCAFNFTYGSSNISTTLSQDTLSLASDVVKPYTFATVTTATGTSVLPQGLLGLGRGPLSFLSQTTTLYASTFSYCLPSFRSLNFSGTLRLGPSGQPIRIKTTPLLSNPRRSSLYYVNLIRIRVGRRFVSIPPSSLAFNPATGAGTVFDSGTMFTRLVAPAYEAVRNEFRRRVNRTVSGLGGFDTCYHGAIVAPTVTFEFTGMNVTLPAENVMIHSSSGDLSCLAMAAAPDNVNSVLNVIASMQQQNHRVLFDVPRGRVGVAREPCTVAAAAAAAP